MGGTQRKCISRHSCKSELSIWSLSPCSSCNPLILPLTRIFRLGGIAPLCIHGAAGLILVAWGWTGSTAAERDVMPAALGSCWQNRPLDHSPMPSSSLACAGPPQQTPRTGTVGPSTGCRCCGCSRSRLWRLLTERPRFK